MKYDLSVLDRMVLLNILPEKANLTTIRIVRELREGLSFSEEEHAAMNLRQLDDGRVMWEEDNLVEKNLEIGPQAANVIRESLKSLDTTDELTADHLGLCDKFEYTGADGS